MKLSHRSMKQFRLQLALLASFAILGGCQTTTDLEKPNIYGGMFGQRVVGNKNGVLIHNVWNHLDAFPLAEKHCLQYGRSARASFAHGIQMGFDCVP